MPIPLLVAAPIAAAGLAAAGGVVSQTGRGATPPLRRLRTYDMPRQTQEELLLEQQRSALGSGPSYAELQMRRAGQQAQAQAQSTVAGTRGTNLALAQRTGAQNQAAINADIAGQAGMARLEEIMQARQAAAQQAGALRAQDLQQEQINLQAQMIRDQQELERKQRNRDRLMQGLTMGAASIGKLGASGGQ